MNITNPLVSVIIPAYNQEKYIEETIKSVLNQAYTNLEVIVVDDESTDTTVEVVKTLQNTDSRVSIYSIKHAGRPSVPRNYGINKSRGEYIAFLDSDDIWTKNKLKAQLEYLESNPLLVFVYSMSVTFGDVNIFSPQFEVLPLLPKASRNYDELIKKGNSITCSSVLIKTGELKKANGFDEDPQLQIEDYDLWLRLAETGPFGFIPRIHVFYRVHKVQYSGDTELKKKRLDYLMKKRGISLPEYRFVRNKNIVLRLLRNLLHVLTFVWVFILEKIETYLFRKPVYK